MDDAIHPTAIHDDDWEAALVAKANGDVPDDQDCADEGYSADEEEPPARPTLYARDAMSSVKVLLNFARVANDDAMIDATTSLENIVEMNCVKQAASARQINHHARVFQVPVDLVYHTARPAYSTAYSVCLNVHCE